MQLEQYQNDKYTWLEISKRKEADRLTRNLVSKGRSFVFFTKEGYYYFIISAFIDLNRDLPKGLEFQLA